MKQGEEPVGMDGYEFQTISTNLRPLVLIGMVTRYETVVSTDEY